MRPMPAGTHTAVQRAATVRPVAVITRTPTQEIRHTAAIMAATAAIMAATAAIMAATSAIVEVMAVIMAIRPAPIGAAATGMAATGLVPITVTALAGFCRCCRSATRPTGTRAFRITTPMTCTTPGARTTRVIRRPIRRRWRTRAAPRLGRHRQSGGCGTARRVTADPAGQSGQIFMYPMNGQSAEQQSIDKQQCQQWAAQQTGQGAAGGPDYQRAMMACIEGRGYSAQ